MHMLVKTFDIKVSTFYDFLTESDNKTEAMRNYQSYMKGTEPLKHAFLTHKDGDSAYDFVKSKVTRNFWVMPREHWDGVLKRHRAELQKVLDQR